MGDRWLALPAAIEIVISRVGVGTGRAQALILQAIDSGEIRASFVPGAFAAEDREAYEEIKKSVQARSPGLKMAGSQLDLVRIRAQRDAYLRQVRRMILLTEFRSPEFKAGLVAGKIQINDSDLLEWLDRNALTPAPAKNRRYSEDEKVVAEAVTGIRRGDWPNPLQAATALASRARGQSTESTIARLRKKIRVALGD